MVVDNAAIIPSNPPLYMYVTVFPVKKGGSYLHLLRWVILKMMSRKVIQRVRKC